MDNELIPRTISEKDFRGGEGNPVKFTGVPEPEVTVTLANSSGERTRYYFRQMIDYCETNNKDINDLTKEEMLMFKVKDDDEC